MCNRLHIFMDLYCFRNDFQARIIFFAPLIFTLPLIIHNHILAIFKLFASKVGLCIRVQKAIQRLSPTWNRAVQQNNQIEVLDNIEDVSDRSNRPRLDKERLYGNGSQQMTFSMEHRLLRLRGLNARYMSTGQSLRSI